MSEIKPMNENKREVVMVHQENYIITQDVSEKYKGKDLIIYADTVTIKGNKQNGVGYCNAGCNLTIYGRIIDLEENTLIETSGINAKNDTTKAAKGNDKNINGQGGIPGKNGMDGGDINLFSYEIRGEKMQFKADGGEGGRGQTGGDGIKGPKGGFGHDASRPQPNDPGIRNIAGHPGAVVIDFWDMWTLDVKSGGRGLQGVKGGNAGLAGVSGNGGNAGCVNINYLNSIAKPPDDQNFTGGTSGILSTSGKPGLGGDGGDGGRNLYRNKRFLVTNWFSDYWVFADSRKFGMTAWQNPKHCISFGIRVPDEYLDKRGRLDLRCHYHGPQGHSGGYGPEGASKNPAPLSGKIGENHKLCVTKYSMQDIPNINITLRYVLIMLQSADVSYINNENDTALDKYKWLQFITKSNLISDTDPEIILQTKIFQGIHQYTSTQIQKIEHGYSFYSLSAHSFKYNNIKLYQDYVEQQIKNAQGLEDRYNKFLSDKVSKEDKKESLNESIDQYVTLISHIEDDIQDKDAKLQTISSAVKDLNKMIIQYQSELKEMPDDLEMQILKKAKENAFKWGDIIDIVSLGIGCITSAVSVGSEVKAVVDLLKEGVKIVDAIKKLSTSGSKIIGSLKTLCTNGYRIFSIFQGGSAVKNPEFIYPDDKGDDALFLPEMQELEFKKTRLEFENQMAAYMEFSAAKKWKQLFTEFLDTAETKINLASQAADVYHEKKELIFRKNQVDYSKEILQKQLQKLHFDPNDDNTIVPLELCYRSALHNSIYRVIDEWTAYRLWTLREVTPPQLDANLTVSRLHDTVYQSINEKVQHYIMDIDDHEPLGKYEPDKPFIWTREEFPEVFAKLKEGKHETYLELKQPKEADFRNIRLAKIAVFLVGATSKNSHIYCELSHSGNCYYTSVKGKQFNFVLPSLKLSNGYKLIDGKPQYTIGNDKLINSPYDIGYSLYTTYTLHVPSKVVPDPRLETFNEGINYDDITEIHLKTVFYYNRKAEEMNRLFLGYIKQDQYTHA